MHIFTGSSDLVCKFHNVRIPVVDDLFLDKCLAARNLLDVRKIIVIISSY